MIGGEFADLLNVGVVSQGPSELWARYNRRREGIDVASENDVAIQVYQVLLEAIRALDLGFYVLSEMEIFGIRPDFYIVATVSGIPKGVVEVKKRGEMAMTNERIGGEVYDHMMHLRSLFGVREVFGILTSYDEWRVCWLQDDASADLAAATSLPELEVFKTPIKVAQLESERPVVDSATKPQSPTVASPWQIAAHNNAIVDELVAVVIESDDEVERSMFSSAIYKREDADHGALFRFVCSVLVKMDRAAMEPRDLSPETRVEGIVRVLTAGTYLWKHVTLEQGLKWSSYPRSNVQRFYVWDDLGRGIDGRALLASSVGGAVCVLKFFFPKAADDAAESRAYKEFDLWHKVYPEYANHVRLVQLSGRQVLMMPHFATPTRSAAVVDGVLTALQESFDARGLVHADVRWRNIGLRENGQPMLYDLGHIVKKDVEVHSDWLDEARKSLMTNVGV
jgi:hypothetical protein